MQLASASDNSSKPGLYIGDNYPIIVPRELLSDSRRSWGSISVNAKEVFHWDCRTVKAAKSSWELVDI